MKRPIIIVTSVVVFILLLVRTVFINIDRDNDAKLEFLSRLDYDLSARVDSVGLFSEHAHVGFLYITVTRGDLDSNEKKIARSIKRSRGLRFLVPFKGNRFEIFSRDAADFKVGDSLLINSKDDKLVLFRASLKVHEYAISENLRVND